MSDSSNIDFRTTPPELPTLLTRKLVRYILGFGVGVGLGLAPYLGLLKLPLFTPLLALIPESIQNVVIPLSSALMGTAAVWIQFYRGERVTRVWLRKLFNWMLLIAILAFIALIIIYTLVVVTVPILGGKESVSFIVGFRRPIKAPCTANISDAECIKLLTFDLSEIESFWGDTQIRLAKLSLIFSYLLFTGLFGIIVGLIVLRDKIKRKRPKRRVPHL